MTQRSASLVLTTLSCKDELDPHFLLHFLKSDYGLEAIARNCSGAVRKRLYYSGLAEIELPIPAINEQRAVVARINKISETTRFIRDQNSDSHELPQLKQAILQEAIQGKLTANWRATNADVEPASQLLHHIQAKKARLIADKKLRPERHLPKITADEIPFEIPTSWEVVGNRGRATRFFDYRQDAKKIATGVRLITAKNVRFGHFSDTPRDFVSEETYKRHMVRGFPERMATFSSRQKLL